MKKFLSIFVFICSTIICSAQGKVFKDALNSAPDQNYIYHATNSSSGLDVDDVKAYAAKNGYIIVGDIATRRISRFGEYVKVAESFSFIPKNGIDAAAYAASAKNGIPYSKMTSGSKGAAYFWCPDTGSFKKYSDVCWTGSVDGGYIDGKGDAYVSDVSGDLKAAYYVSGQFKKGIPCGEIKITQYKYTADDTYAQGAYFETPVIVNEFHEGFASFVKDSKSGFVNTDMDIVVPAKYKEVISEFRNDPKTSLKIATVLNDSNAEINIDTEGNSLGYSDFQKLAFAMRDIMTEDNTRKEAERESEARRLKEQEEFYQQQQELEARRRDGDYKKNCVGKKIVWHETISFDTSGGGLGGLLMSAAGLGTTSYDIEYTGIVESVIGGVSVKVIITNARIDDPKFASANYFKYRDDAKYSMSENIGKTRVLEFNQFSLL